VIYIVFFDMAEKSEIEINVEEKSMGHPVVASPQI
jgi:hypothetical protein